ncbi:MAG: aromatic amino acid lyase, partial [Pseudomonadota bacterium]
MNAVLLQPGRADLALLADIANARVRPRIDPSAQPAVEAAAQCVSRAVEGDNAVYGVNTGFGKLATVRIAAADTATLQRNLILSHCAGVGEPADARSVRLMMVLKVLSLGRGASGVRWRVLTQIQALIDADIVPHVPAQGSVGASGDLAPLAHMAAALLGEGDVWYHGTKQPADTALAAAGIAPIELAAKE